MRLNPRYPLSYLWTLGHSDYLTGRTPDAISAFRQVVEQNPNFVAAHAYLAVAYSEMGRPADARRTWTGFSPRCTRRGSNDLGLSTRARIRRLRNPGLDVCPA